MKSVGIIGYGFVGKALGQLAIKDQIRCVPFDVYNESFAGPQQMLEAFNCDYVVVCVPTPQDEDGMLDVSIVVDAAEKWEEFCQNEESILVIKSTVPPGCVDELCEHLETDRIVHNPEFLSQNTHMEDFMNIDEIVVGGKREHCESLMELYKTWVHVHPVRKSKLRFEDGGYTVYGEPSYVITDAMTAEMIKMVRNSFYATKLTFMNEVRDLCDKMKINYGNFRETFARSGKNSWINPQHTVVPGVDGKRGFGGKCLPKDAIGLVALAKTYDVEMPVLEAANKSNKDRRPEAYDEEDEHKEVDDL